MGWNWIRKWIVTACNPSIQAFYVGTSFFFADFFNFFHGFHKHIEISFTYFVEFHLKISLILQISCADFIKKRCIPSTVKRWDCNLINCMLRTFGLVISPIVWKLTNYGKLLVWFGSVLWAKLLRFTVSPQYELLHIFFNNSLNKACILICSSSCREIGSNLA